MTVRDLDPQAVPRQIAAAQPARGRVTERGRSLTPPSHGLSDLALLQASAWRPPRARVAVQQASGRGLMSGGLPEPARLGPGRKREQAVQRASAPGSTTGAYCWWPVPQAHWRDQAAVYPAVRAGCDERVCPPDAARKDQPRPPGRGIDRQYKPFPGPRQARETPERPKPELSRLYHPHGVLRLAGAQRLRRNNDCIWR